MGAAVMMTKACLRTGAGLTTVHVPKHGVAIIQTAAPEAMAQIDSKRSISQIILSLIIILLWSGSRHRDGRSHADCLEAFILYEKKARSYSMPMH